jgi:hypothetical protein
VAFFFNEHVVIDGDLLSEISNERNVNLAKSSFLSWGVDPSQVRIFRVNRQGNDFSTNLAELLSSLREGNNFSWANKGKI